MKSISKEHYLTRCVYTVVICLSAEVGKVLKKFEETIPAMIHLLNPDGSYY